MSEARIRNQRPANDKDRTRVKVSDISDILDDKLNTARSESRDRTINSAQEQALFIRSSTEHPLTSTRDPPTLLIAGNGRSLTDLGYETSGSDILRVHDDDEKPHGKNRVEIPRSSCPRFRNPALLDLKPFSSSLSRQCCDVLGPKVCHECAKLNRRQKESKRFQTSSHNCLYVSEGNYASAAVVSRAYPGMTQQEIQHRLARGDICRPSFKYDIQRARTLREGTTTASSAPPRGPQRPVTYNFFSSIKDLNDKITRGELVRKIIITGDPEKDLARQEKQPREKTFSQALVARFVSHRKPAAVKRKQSRYRSFYEPPLLPKVCQNVEPAFFAGAISSYKLPGRARPTLLEGSSSLSSNAAVVQKT